MNVNVYLRVLGHNWLTNLAFYPLKVKKDVGIRDLIINALVYEDLISLEMS